MLLTRYGLREWLSISVVAALIAAAIIWLASAWSGMLWWVLIPLAVVWLALLAFFRDPVRQIPQDLPPGTMLSPADGVVSAVEKVDHHDATGGPAVIVRIFLSVLDVHLNRAPCDGQVVSIVHKPGRYLNAQTEESAKVNESNLITMRLPEGEETIGVRQVAGMIARRIVCQLSPGDALKQGQPFGMIKFGSTTELIVSRPDDVTVHVHKGEKVRAGLTTLATLRPAETTTQDSREVVAAATPPVN
ncbi:MAG: phosphatidylserine decarboxylase family protein [Phycisphaerales bacterium]|nr:MAG: phosphatidylserine decarboxylase family protein [Phycisphaerales bacterium]